ncbi:MAG: ATP-binding cassette domain-containing protein, partial [Burkholderiales bacterium]|nr:ATP-binding cassette domain-containing protein [Burkholderiales bacterium]
MLEVRGLAKSFAPGAKLFEGIDLEVKRGEWVAIVGESGCGKSTLLNIVAGLDSPDRGEVRLDGEALDYHDDDRLALWRRRHLGFVFQAFHLLPYLDVAENVALPLALLGAPVSERARRAHAALDAVGLAPLASRAPGS